MKLAVLFSGGKDSTYAMYLAKKNAYEISCLISIFSVNKASFMFHTPSIRCVRKQAEVMNIPLITRRTKGKKEDELKDLENVIKEAIGTYKIEGIVTGAVESIYQTTRIQKICNKLNIECFNPLWQKDQIELLKDLIKNKFEVIVTGVFAEGLGKEFLGRKIDDKFIGEMRKLNRELGVSPSGEGGEFESFVINCPLFKKGLIIKSYKDFEEGNYSFRRELTVY